MDLYKDYVAGRIEAAKPHWVPASVLLGEIRARGYDGGTSRLRSHVAKFKLTDQSPATYIRFSEHERQEDWLTGSTEAFQYFGGVSREVLFDNTETIMIERDAFDEGECRWNAQLLNLAKDYGFLAPACRPYRLRIKGKAEHFNGYLKHSFITPLAPT